MIEYSGNSRPRCLECGEKYHPKRKQLGYMICLECGDGHAQREAERKSKCIAPLFNKGAYQYVGSVKEAKDIGR